MNKLKRTKQCELCPWKVSTNPYDIPDNYSVERHRALAKTIADGDNVLTQAMSDGFISMSCHEHATEDKVHCVGWLHNQLGVGNNIRLRMALIDYENIGDIKLDGEQHPTFTDTLPKE